MKVNTGWATYDNVTLTRERYGNGRVALQLWCDDGPLATVSVNLTDEELDNTETDFFVDTNNCPWAPEFLEGNGIAEPLGLYGFSGFCAYPLYRLNERR